MQDLVYVWTYRCRYTGCRNSIVPREPSRFYCAEHSPSAELHHVAFAAPIFLADSTLAFMLRRERARA